MIFKPDKDKLRLERHKRARGKISGTAERPRLSVFRSNKNVYARIIDDVVDVMLAGASILGKPVPAEGTKFEQTRVVGKTVTEAAKKNSITIAVFDRSGYLYYSRIQTLADAVCKNGLEF